MEKEEAMTRFFKGLLLLSMTIGFAVVSTDVFAANTAVVTQDGDNGSGTISQTGDLGNAEIQQKLGAAYALATVTQSAGPNDALVIQAGTGASGTGNSSTISQTGDGLNENQALVAQGVVLTRGTANDISDWTGATDATFSAAAITNTATITQLGGSNFAIVEQPSATASAISNTVTIVQGVTSAMTGNSVDAVQSGTGNTATVDQDSNSNSTDLDQTGNTNTADIDQAGVDGHTATVTQAGNLNAATVNQGTTAVGVATISQPGSSNTGTINQNAI
jgi:hypothetical protein